MGHYARVVNDEVVQVIVAKADQINNEDFGPSEQWIKCSYNTYGGVHRDPETSLPSADQTKALRKNFPSPGYTYDVDRDAFIGPKPFASWVLNEETCQWEPPVDMPADSVGENPIHYIWDEETTNWVSTGPYLPS
jgi:hypothetical protein